jgi:diacylglycerol O-acyltransferase / wax synthase
MTPLKFSDLQDILASGGLGFRERRETAMQRMTGIDPMFIYSQTPVSPMEVAYACVFDPSTAADGYSFERVREVLAQRVPDIAPFRRRLVEVPLGLDHPRWVDDPDFDLDDHLHRAALPAPGGDEEFSNLAAQVMGRPLEPDQPPWEMHVVEGLSGGRIGLIAKLHHSVIDGVSGALILAQLLDITAEVAVPTEARSPWRPPALPSGVQLVTEALPRVLTSPLRLIRAAREVGRTTVRLARHAADAETPAVSIPLLAPAQFSTQVTARRTVSFAETSLNDVLALKERLGVTLNDVVLAVCSGALRTYLSDHGRETDNPLVAVVPVSVRSESEHDSLGNRLSAMFVPLANHRAQPLDRLRTVAAASDDAKVQERAVGYGTMASAVSDAVVPAVAGPAVRLGVQLGAVRRLRPGNLVISNVPGPRIPLYFAGMCMESVYPMGPVVDGVALNITVQSYKDSLYVGVNACSKAVPDAAALARCVVDEVGYLVEAVNGAAGGDGTPKVADMADDAPASAAGDGVARFAPRGVQPTSHATGPKVVARRPRTTRPQPKPTRKTGIPRPAA